MSLKSFRFVVTNQHTGESAAFIGDGKNMEEALKDGVKNCNSTFRPKNDGAQRPSMGLAVTTRSGLRNRSISDFEGDFSFEQDKDTGEDLF